MQLAVASGKGGTGKTTVATSLAARLARRGPAVAYVDCDVEAPNGHLFLQPAVTREEPVGRLVPRVDEERCGHCGACARICRFHAIVSLPERTLVYEELCHSCGGCTLVCPTGAITQVSHPMGTIQTGLAGPVHFVSGTLDVGEANSPPLIRAAKRAAPAADWVILDAPPGTACPMIETVRDCDYVLLVTEPTPFGLHDLRLAIEVARTLHLPCGVVVNRAQPGIDDATELCARLHAPIVGEIPDAIAIAQAYSQGRLVIDAVPNLEPVFDRLIDRLLAAVPKAGTTRATQSSTRNAVTAPLELQSPRPAPAADTSPAHPRNVPGRALAAP